MHAVASIGACAHRIILSPFELMDGLPETRRSRQWFCDVAPNTYNFLYVQEVSAMRTVTYSESRAHYAETLDSVVDDREEVVVTRSGHDSVVMVALDDYESLKETAYMLKSPENARRLLASIDRLEHGGGTERDLAE